MFIWVRAFYLWFWLLVLHVITSVVSGPFPSIHLLIPLLVYGLFLFGFWWVSWFVVRYFFDKLPRNVSDPLAKFWNGKKAQYLSWEARKIEQLKETIKTSPKAAYNRLYPMPAEVSAMGEMPAPETIENKAEYVKQRSGQLATMKQIYSEILGKNFD
jgi:hypothetical protein